MSYIKHFDSQKVSYSYVVSFSFGNAPHYCYRLYGFFYHLHSYEAQTCGRKYFGGGDLTGGFAVGGFLGGGDLI